MSSPTTESVEDLLRCFICLGRVSEPMLCPACSKMCCADCILKWLTENRSNCPHCRSPLSPQTLVSGRFVAEISQALDRLTDQPSHSEKCSTHSTPLNYFCVTCSSLICSDCAMFDSLHKGHEFQRLNVIYDQQVNALKTEADQLLVRLQNLGSISMRIQTNLQEVRRGKETATMEIVAKIDQMQTRLERTLKEKVSPLVDLRGVLKEEISRIEAVQGELTTYLTGPKSRLISAIPRLLQLVKTRALGPVPAFQAVSPEFVSELAPPFVTSTFVLRDFSALQTKAEVVYSDLLQDNGLVWRLKVYPNGNGVARGSHLSVFLELVKGTQEAARYEYKVELLNFRDPGLHALREFSSDFSSGECWGYNRFLMIDKLTSEGFIDPQEEAIVFRFSVRAASYSDMCRDQKRYIEALETENRSLNTQRDDLLTRLRPYSGAEKKSVFVSLETPETMRSREEEKSHSVQKSSERLSWIQGDCEMSLDGERGEDPETRETERAQGLSLLIRNYMMSPVAVSSESDGSPDYGVEESQGFRWNQKGMEDENDETVGNGGNPQSLWIEKRFSSLMDSPTDAV